MATVTKREWKAPDGSKKSAWVVRYVDNGGKQKQATFEKKREADLYRSKIEMDLNRGVAVTRHMTVREATQHFLQALRERVVDGAIGRTHEYRTEGMLRLHVIPHLGNVRLDDLRLHQLEEWFRHLRLESGLGPRSAIGAACALKMVFDHAIKREWVFKNPVPSLLAEKRGMKVAAIATFTPEQIRALLQAVDAPMYKGRTPDAAMRLRCAVHLAIFCTLRIGEIFALSRDDIDFEHGIIRVRRSISKRDGMKAPKSRAGIRDVAMPAHVSALLAEWLRDHQVPTGPKNPAGTLFTYRGGQPMDCDGFRNGSWAPLLVRAGLSSDAKKPPFHFHALRHFAASWMLDSGWSLPEVAGAMGHAKPDLTLGVYAHALQKRGASRPQVQALTDRLMAPPAILLPAPRAVGSEQIEHGAAK